MATKDYKARERSRPNRLRRGGGSGFFWFVTGAVCGAFGVGLAWTLQERTPPPAGQASQAEPQAAAQPNFVFHQLLPEMEVLVPDEELNAAPPVVPPAPAPAPAPVPATADKPTSPPSKSDKAPEPAAPAQTAKADQAKGSSAQSASYLVQVAAFHTASEAERLKAKLALLGIQTSIQQVTVNGKEYHRVRAGPYAGTDEVKAAQALLGSKGFESLAVKVK